MSTNIEVLRSRDKQFYWHRRASNGQVTGGGWDRFTRYAACRDNMRANNIKAPEKWEHRAKRLIGRMVRRGGRSRLEWMFDHRASSRPPSRAT